VTQHFFLTWHSCGYKFLTLNKFIKNTSSLTVKNILNKMLKRYSTQLKIQLISPFKISERLYVEPGYTLCSKSNNLILTFKCCRLWCV